MWIFRFIWLIIKIAFYITVIGICIIFPPAIPFVVGFIIVSYFINLSSKQEEIHKEIVKINKTTIKKK